MKLKPILVTFAAAVIMMLISVTAGAANTHDYSHKSGTYSGGQLVWITADDDVELYYTVDGSLPDNGCTPVGDLPVVVTENTKIRCAAYTDGMLTERSSVTIKIRTAQPHASVQSGSYAGSVRVALTCPDKKAKIFYTTDGSIPDNSSKQYKGSITLDKSATLKFIALKDGCSYSKYVTEKYEISECVQDEDCARLLELINDLRQQYGLTPLKIMPKLQELSQLRAEELPLNCSHYRPDGTKWDYLLYLNGLKRNVRAENIAYYFDSADGAYGFWLNSYYHCMNMLNSDARYIGIGHYSNSWNDYWVLLILGDE